MAIQTTAPTGKPSKATTTTAPVLTRSEPFGDRLIAWINAHRQIAYWVGAVLVVGGGLFVWQLATARRSEEIAGRELQRARFAFENQNLPLAASELARVIENYSGTNAAEEGRLLLANVRLQQGQTQQAIEALGEYAPRAGRAYRAQAYGLLGAGYENLGRSREAAEAYENGAEAARLDFLKAQMLSDAGRAWTAAADTTRAIAAYEQILKDFPNERVSAAEAKVRLGELKKNTVS